MKQEKKISVNFTKYTNEAVKLIPKYSFDILYILKFTRKKGATIDNLADDSGVNRSVLQGVVQALRALQYLDEVVIGQAKHVQITEIGEIATTLFEEQLRKQKKKLKPTMEYLKKNSDQESPINQESIEVDMGFSTEEANEVLTLLDTYHLIQSVFKVKKGQVTTKKVKVKELRYSLSDLGKEVLNFFSGEQIKKQEKNEFFFDGIENKPTIRSILSRLYLKNQLPKSALDISLVNEEELDHKIVQLLYIGCITKVVGEVGLEYRLQKMGEDLLEQITKGKSHFAEQLKERFESTIFFEDEIDINDLNQFEDKRKIFDRLIDLEFFKVENGYFKKTEFGKEILRLEE